MQETGLGKRPAGARSTAARPWFGPDSAAWLVAVSALYLLAQLLPALLNLPLGADEITYIARTSAHHSAVLLPPVHGHGVGLLAAPVTLLTTSLLAVRMWMALLSAVALLLSLLCWRRLRPAWMLALGGFIFASLAITQLSGVQVYPDLWGGFGALAITGLLLQAADGHMRRGVVLTLMAFVAFFIVLLRPQNIVFVLAPAFLAALVVRRWRGPDVLVAMLAGMAAGVLEWVAEAYLWYGGLANRIQLARQEPPSLGLHFSLLTQVRALSGPWYCDPASGGCQAGNYPWLIFWWMTLLGLVAVGVYATWRTKRQASAVLAVVSGASMAGLYILFVPFGAPRYLLPTWALFAIVAADGIAWMATVPHWRRAGVVVAGAFLLTGVVTQHLVLVRETAGAAAVRPFIAKADYLREMGITPPCVLNYGSSAYVAYYLGCSGPNTGNTPREMLRLMPGGDRGWRLVTVPAGGPYRGRTSVWVKS